MSNFGKQNEITLEQGSEAIKSVPRWHFGMLNDTERNFAFETAIESIDLKNKTVLDVGTGTGLLAMIAAKNGAKHVYTVEMNPYIADKAIEIIHKNNLKDKISVINKISTELVSGVDLPKNIDVLISETVDCGFFGELFVSSLQYAKQNLLAPDAVLIPSSVKLISRLFSSPKIRSLNEVASASNFDISMFNHFSTPGYFPVRLNTWEHEIITNEVVFYEKNFNDVYDDSVDDNISFIINRNSKIDGIVFWFELTLVPDGVTITNSPQNKKTHWMQAVQLFEEPRQVYKDEKCFITYSANTRTIFFDCE